MSKYISPEFFATEVLRHLDCKYELCDIFINFSKPYTTNEFPTNLILHVGHAVWCRYTFFRIKLLDDISQNYREFSSSGIDYYLYFINYVDMLMPSRHMNIFEKVFMSLAVIMEMAYICWLNEEEETHIYNTPMYWAMYFDSILKNSFFVAGGWDVLLEHAARYVDSNVLCDENLIDGFEEDDDLSNVLELWPYVNNTFDVTTLIMHYEEMCIRGKRRACTSCHPLFIVLQSVRTKISTKFDTNELIEGYLQFFLKLPKKDMLSAFEVAKKVQSSKDTNACQKDIHTENPPTNIEEEHEDKERKRIFTDCLIKRIFIEKQYSEQVENSNTEILDNFCVFCSKNLSETPSESLTSEPWNHIKSRIHETIESEKSIEIEQNKKMESIKLKPKSSSKIVQQKYSSCPIKNDTNFIKEANSELDGSNQEQLNRGVDIEEDSNSVKRFIVYESGLLKMFSTLGCKEETIYLLNSLNEDNKNEDLSLGVHNLSQEKEQTETNIKNISKKKKKKKR